MSGEGIYDRLNKTKIGNKRGPIRRTRSKSLDHLPPVVDLSISTKIAKQFEHLQEAYKAAPPPVILAPSQPPNSERRRSLLRKTSNDDILVGRSTIVRPRSTLRPSTVDSTRPPNTNRPTRILHRGLSKDDNDIPNDKLMVTAHPPPLLQPTPPTAGRRGSMTPSRVLKRGQSKDDSELHNTGVFSTTQRSPRKVWTSTKADVIVGATIDCPHLLFERPKLFWRQRMSASFLVYHHILPPIVTSTANSTFPPSSSSPPRSPPANPDLSCSYFEIIPIDAEKKGYQFDRVYVSVATLVQMKSKEFEAIIESRPRSITTKPYASKEEIARVNKMKREEKFKLLIDTCADYCIENIDVSQEDSTQERIVFILRKYHGMQSLFSLS